MLPVLCLRVVPGGLYLVFVHDIPHSFYLRYHRLPSHLRICSVLVLLCPAGARIAVIACDVLCDGMIPCIIILFYTSLKPITICLPIRIPSITPEV